MLLEEADIPRGDIAIWNIVPWYIGRQDRSKIRPAKGSDVEIGCATIRDICNEIKNLKAVILVGGAARQAHVHLSTFCSCGMYSIHHPSPKVFNNFPEKRVENIQVLKFIKKTYC